MANGLWDPVLSLSVPVPSPEPARTTSTSASNGKATTQDLIKKAKEMLKARKKKPLEPSSVCNICGTKCWGDLWLAAHKKRYHSKECPDCKKTFSRKDNMTAHRLSVHSSNGPECPDCGKKFSRESNLRAHRLTAHSSNPPTFKCDTCGKSFTQKQNLNRHVEEVHEGSFYECENCQAKFRRVEKLKKHREKCASK